MKAQGIIDFARFVAIAGAIIFIAIFSFFFIGEMSSLLRGHSQSNYDAKALFILCAIGLYCISLVLACKWPVAAGAVAFALIMGLNLGCHTWHVPFYFLAVVPPVLFMISGMLSRYYGRGV